MTQRIAIIKTGSTYEPLKLCLGDFDDWFQRGISGLSFNLIDVTAGERAPPAETFDKYIITGSPHMVTDKASWSEGLKPWLRELVSLSRPVLAVCYGHQLLAEALGGSVDWHPSGREIGTVSIELTPEAKQDPLLSSLPKPFHAHVSHSQTVTRLPPGATLLAGNAFEPHHGFRIGNCAWGLQFHPEFNTEIMAAYVLMSAEKLSKDHDVGALYSEIQDTPAANQLVYRFLVEL